MSNKASPNKRRRMLRTVLLGVLALAAICYALIAWFGQSNYEVLLLLGAGAVAVAGMAAAGVLGGYVLYRVRKRR